MPYVYMALLIMRRCTHNLYIVTREWKGKSSHTPPPSTTIHMNTFSILFARYGTMPLAFYTSLSLSLWGRHTSNRENKLKRFRDGDGGGPYALLQMFDHPHFHFQSVAYHMCAYNQNVCAVCENIMHSNGIPMHGNRMFFCWLVL